MPDPLDALRRDPAVLAADAETRRWLLALLTYGEHASDASPVPSDKPRKRPGPSQRRTARPRD